MQYGVISDIHANLEALQAALDRLQGAEGFICLGDLVGYGPNPNECVEIIRRLPNLLCIVGNHDLAAIGKYDVSWFNPYAREAIEWTAEQLYPEHKEYLGSLPFRQELPPFTLVHGALPEPMDYVLGPREALGTLRQLTTPACLIGHTHVAEYYRQSVGEEAVEGFSLLSGGEIELEKGFRYLINCGSVGQPRDGNPQACCGLWDDGTKIFTLYRVRYPIVETQRKMTDALLPKYLIQRLAMGK